MDAARNGFSCQNQDFSATLPPCFVFPQATPENSCCTSKRPGAYSHFSQIGLQEIANEKLETISVIGAGPGFRDC